MKIFNRKIKKIFRKFKTDTERFIASLKIDDKVESLISESEKTNSRPECIGDYFVPIYGYYRRTFNLIIQQAAWHLKQELEADNAPPIKPRYQFIFRTYLHNQITGLINQAINKIEPAMIRFKMPIDPTGPKLDIQMDIFKILYEQDNNINNVFTPLFSYYNVSIRPFKDSIRSTIAIILSVLGFILTILINFRNEIWNFLFPK